MRGFKFALAAILTASSIQCEAGVWDRIKNVFLPQEEPEAPTIRALVFRNEPATMLEVKGAFNLWDPYKNTKIATKFGAKKSLIESRSFGLKWGEEFPGTYQMKVIPDDPSTRIVVNGIEYKGSVYIYDVSGKLCIINEVDIENYVESVLSGLFDKSLSKEAMNAIAIASRTDAYHHAKNSTNPYWHVDADKTGYQGYAATRKKNGVNTAVQSTKHMVMNLSTTYSSNKIATFPANIVKKELPNVTPSSTTLSVDKIEQLAQRGLQADRILTSIYPNTTISLIHSFPDQTSYEIADSK